MERSYPQSLRISPQQFGYAASHLARGPVRERDGENLPRRNVVSFYEVRDTRGEHPGLARTGSCENERWPAAKFDCRSLGGIESGRAHPASAGSSATNRAPRSIGSNRR